MPRLRAKLVGQALQQTQHGDAGHRERSGGKSLSNGIEISVAAPLSEEALPQHSKQRLDNPQRQRMISESDYAERSLWPKYIEAYDGAIERTSTSGAPWFVIPAEHKWFWALAIAQIISDAMQDLELKVPDSQKVSRRGRWHMADEEWR